MICVYPADCTDFSTNGNGALSPISATVTETLNGEYELQLEHPIDENGKWQRLVEGCILRAPVPAAMTPAVNYHASGSSSAGKEIWRINTDIPSASVRGGTLRLRSGPGDKYKVLANYKNGSTVQVLNKTNSSWYECTAPDGKHGYFSTKYLTLERTESSYEAAVNSVVESRQLRDQPFRIYRVVPSLDKITVYARHIFYDLLDNMIASVKPSSSQVGASVVQQISAECMTAHDFTFYSDLDATAEEVEYVNTNPVDALLGEDGVVDKYAGELTRDWFDVYLVKRVGRDTNVQIRQGKNLLGISYDIDITDVVTRIMPTGENISGDVFYLPEVFVDSPYINNYPHPKWMHLPVSEAKESTDEDNPKTLDQCRAEMRAAAQKKFEAGCDQPTVTLNVDYINTADTEEYRDYVLLQNIYLGDAVRVIVPRIGIWVSMRMTQYTYDCLTKRYTKITLGTVADTVEGNVISSRQLPSGIITGTKLAINSVGAGALQNGSVSSAHIQIAAIDTAHIQDAAITRAKIGEAAVGSAQIQDAAIIRAKIAEGAIGSAQIDNASITRAKIADAAIGTAQIEDGSINSAHIGAGEIQEAHIHDGAITHAKIGDGEIHRAHIEDGAIDSAKIADAAITNAKIDGAAIGTANIQDGAIVRAKILDGEIVTAKIADLAVTSGKIADLAVSTAKIANAAITNAQIANAAVDTAQIALGAITAALIQNGAVGTAQIADASITEGKIVSLNADVIQSGTLATERLIIRGEDGLIYQINALASGLSMQELSEEQYKEQLDGSVLVKRSVTAEQIAAATITANEILSGTITGDKIAAATIEGANLKAGIITTSHLSSEFGKTLDLSSNTGINQRVEKVYSDIGKVEDKADAAQSTADDAAANAIAAQSTANNAASSANQAQHTADSAITAAGNAQSIADSALSTAEKALHSTEVIVGTQTSTTAAWTGIASFAKLEDKQQIVYWLPTTSAANATLNLTLSTGSNTGAKNIYINGATRCGTHVAAGNLVQMVYRENVTIGTTKYTGWWISRSQDTTTNYYDRINYKPSVTAAEAIAAGRIGVFNTDGKLILLSTTPFDVTMPILYIGTAYTAEKLTQTNNYVCYGAPFALNNTVSGFSGVAGDPVYIKGTLNGKMFTPAAGVLTCSAPTSDDGYTYILLGLMSTATSGVLAPEHPMFRFYNGGFKSITEITYEAYVAAEDAASAADTAQSTADSAITAAGSAQSTANEANSAASAAQSTAISAATAAGNAQNKADSAYTAAEGAQSTADDAAAAASAAQSTADNAISAAADAQSTADYLFTHSGNNLVWRTTNTSIDREERASLCGFDYDSPRAGNVHSAGGTFTMAEHGYRVTATPGNRPRFLIGSSSFATQMTLSDPLMGLKPGHTYTLSGDGKFRAFSNITSSDNNTYYWRLYAYWARTGATAFPAATVLKTIESCNNANGKCGTDLEARIEVPFTVPEDAIAVFFACNGNSGTGSLYAEGDYIEIANLKIEEGERATPWTPAPEDTEASIAAAKSYTDSVVADVQSQLDGKIDTWFYAVAPNLSNAPAKDWDAPAKAAHEDDLYYDMSTGYCYRWTGTDWSRIKDSDITSAMTAASDAQDTADHKRRVFTTEPTTPYDQGDLWAGGSSADLMVCITARDSGTFVAADWALASASVNDIEIGGRNLLLDTDAPTLTKVAGPGNRYFSDSGVATVIPSMIEVTDAPVNVSHGARFVVTEAVSGKTRQLCWYTGAPVPMMDGEVYTLSCYARITEGETMRLYFRYGVAKYPSHAIEITNTDWKRYSWTFTFSSVSAGAETSETYGAGARIYIGAHNALAGTLEICGFQLEKGNKVTDWTLAPEDMAYSIAAAQSTANAANTAAGNAQNTADNAASVASTAQSTANTAKSTADTAKTTADTAQSTAITAKNTADTAKSTATTAKSTADSAKSTADTAKNTADAALLNANKALSNTEIVVGTQTEASEAWTGNASFSALEDGQQIVYWLPYASAANVTLQLTLAGGNTTSAIPCFYGGTTRLGTHYTAGNAVHLTYRENANVNGVNVTGWWADANYNTNTNYYDRINYKASVTAAGAISAGRLGVFNSAGKLVLLSTTPFDVTKPILYVGTAYTSTALTQTNNYISWGTAFSLANTISGFKGTAGASVYIKGTVSGNMFTPVAGVLTCTVPTSDDGYTYLLLGLMSTATNAVLAPEHPMFRYYKGGFKTINQIACEAYIAADSASEIAASVQEEVEGLSFGGRNMLRNSATLPDGAWVPNAGTWKVASGGNGTGEATEVDDPRVPVSVGMKITGNTSGNKDLQTLLTTIEPDTEYTFSAWIRVASTGIARLMSRFYGTSSICSTTVEHSSVDYPDWFHWSTVKKTPSTISVGQEITWSLGVAGNSADIEIAAPKLERGNRVTDWSPAPEDADETLQLKIASVYAQITNEGDSIRSEVQANYARATDMNSVQARLSTLSEQSENNYTWAVTRITQMQEDLDTAREATEEEMSVLRTYMTFGEEGLSIGKTGNPFTFRVINDRLAFYMNDTEVAYLSNNKLYVTQAEILTKLIIGKFAFEPQSNGNLSLIFNG